MITSMRKAMRAARPSLVTVFAISLPTCLWISSVAAQTQRSAGALEEIIVTAQKREQNLQDIGMTITAFTGDDIRDFGFTNAQDLAKQTPALSFNLNANDDVSSLHDRMPVLLPRDAWATWLDPDEGDQDLLRSLLTPAPDGILDIHPVSMRVNDVRNDGPELTESIDLSQPPAEGSTDGGARGSRPTEPGPEQATLFD